MINTAVYSHWTKPTQQGNSQFKAHGGFANDYYFALAFHYSVFCARKHFGKVVLYTDTDGAKLLVDIFKLPFDEVFITLDHLHYNGNLWAVGKLETYAAQSEPFLHIDADVFLQTICPDKQADVVVQSEEVVHTIGMYKNIWQQVTKHFEHIPAGWQTFDATRTIAYNTGILGGNNYQFLNDYANRSLYYIEKNKHLHQLIDLNTSNIFFEQYALAAETKESNIEVTCFLEPYCTDAKAKGYIHLISSAKAQTEICQHIEYLVRQNAPSILETVNYYLPAQ